MPHFIARSCDYQLPLKEGGIHFTQEFKGEGGVSLLLAQCEGMEFLIKKTPHKEGWLLKPEKLTRPSSTGILKKALLALGRHCEILWHNLSSISMRQSTQSPYLLDEKALINRFCSQQNIKKQNTEKWSLEIGFGSGRHLLDLALKHPQELFLGIEIHTPSLEQVHRQIQILGLQNLFLTKLDARLLVSFLHSNDVDAIYLHFPIPWNKKPHRRVLTESFLNEALRVLKKGGFLHWRSDDETYFQEALKMALQMPNLRLEVQKNCQDRVVSKYEARWRKQEKNIYDIKFYSLFDSAPKVLEYDFSIPYFTEIPKNQKLVGEDYFLHIHRSFRSKDSIILSLSFGDFNFPNTSFIILDCVNKKTKFLGSAPLEIKANIKAHRALLQLLGV